MRARQWPTCCAVVERGSTPGDCAVTLLAGLRESALHVIGVGGSLKVLKVATHARAIGDVVVVVDMALGAR